MSHSSVHWSGDSCDHASKAHCGYDVLLAASGKTMEWSRGLAIGYAGNAYPLFPRHQFASPILWSRIHVSLLTCSQQVFFLYMYRSSFHQLEQTTLSYPRSYLTVNLRPWRSSPVKPIAFHLLVDVSSTNGMSGEEFTPKAKSTHARRRIEQFAPWAEEEMDRIEFETHSELVMKVHRQHVNHPV